MAILEVQKSDSGTGPTGSGTAFNLPVNVTAGNAVVLCIATSTPANSVSAVTGCGVTWARIGTHLNVPSAEGLEVWWGGSSAGGSKAVTPTIVGGYYAQVTEFSGIGTTGTTAQNLTTTSTPQQAISATTGQLVIAACVSQIAITAFTGLTSDYNGAATGPAWRWTSGIDSAYQIVGSSATYTPTWTTTAGNAGVLAATFTVAGAAVPLPFVSPRLDQAVKRASFF